MTYHETLTKIRTAVNSNQNDIKVVYSENTILYVSLISETGKNIFQKIEIGLF